MQPASMSFTSLDSHTQQQQQQQHRQQQQNRDIVGTSIDSPYDTNTSLASMDTSSASNLHRFLNHTTPHVTAQFLSKTELRSLGSQGSQGLEKGFFSLNDLWESYGEWSAYGVGVPILLDGKETVMQYYVPYLSGIQLYSLSANRSTLKSRRRLGDDSDSSEMDYRDSNSETSSCDGEPERIFDQASCSSSDLEERVHEGETLLFEYFESAPPYLRVPLSEKIKELSADFHGLRNLSSNDLSKSSWLSIAWYPIYRIPTGRTLKDLAACFLTYHSISTLCADGCGKLSKAHSWHGTRVALNPFGLAGYKFWGPLWTSAGAADRLNASLLRRSCDEWLKCLYVRHPDFEYFKSHCTPVRRRG